MQRPSSLLLCLVTLPIFLVHARPWNPQSATQWSRFCQIHSESNECTVVRIAFEDANDDAFRNANVGAFCQGSGNPNCDEEDTPWWATRNCVFAGVVAGFFKKFVAIDPTTINFSAEEVVGRDGIGFAAGLSYGSLVPKSAKSRAAILSFVKENCVGWVKQLDFS